MQIFSLDSCVWTIYHWQTIRAPNDEIQHITSLSPPPLTITNAPVICCQPGSQPLLCITSQAPLIHPSLWHHPLSLLSRLYSSDKTVDNGRRPRAPGTDYCFWWVWRVAPSPGTGQHTWPGIIKPGAGQYIREHREHPDEEEETEFRCQF